MVVISDVFGKELYIGDKVLFTMNQWHRMIPGTIRSVTKNKNIIVVSDDGYYSARISAFYKINSSRLYKLDK